MALGAAVGWHFDPLTLHVILPIGISFYTFMTISYVIDVYRREIQPTTHLLDFALFVAYFPHLVAGPILRASLLLPQIERPRTITRAADHAAACGSSAGAASRRCSWPTTWRRWSTPSSGRRRRRPARTCWSPSWAFAFQIYGDFAGYSNIARGVSRHDGHRAQRQFPVPVLRHLAAGVLAALAHQPVHVAARLPLHSARRQPARRVEDASQSADHDDAGRPLARRGVDVRRSGASTRALVLVVGARRFGSWAARAGIVIRDGSEPAAVRARRR